MRIIIFMILFLALPCAALTADLEQRVKFLEEKVISLEREIWQLKQQQERAATPPEQKVEQKRLVPVGKPVSKGTEAGVSVLAYVYAFIQQNWVLSPYLLELSHSANVEAKATLNYSVSGKLLRFRINTPSGNQQFDDSMKRAITKSDLLPQPLEKDLQLAMIFNLKDIVAARR